VGIKAKISLLPALEAKKTDITDLYLNNPDSFKAVILNIIKDAKLHIPGRKHRSEPISHKVSKILGIMRLSDLYDFNSSRQKFQIKCVFPDHNDTQASMSIDLTKNVFYCHGDGRGGGPLQFLMYLKGLTKSEAVKLIEMRFKK
jgi:DNA primase